MKLTPFVIQKLTKGVLLCHEKKYSDDLGESRMVSIGSLLHYCKCFFCGDGELVVDSSPETAVIQCGFYCLAGI